MNQIHILDQQTANSIAAGEVVERPASVVKELVENALDAGASVLTIEIRQGGISLIRVTDNGSGMSRDDAMLAFARHSTSKISRIEDLDSIATMGFRGEALASVAAVARVRLETRQADDELGTWLQMAGGELLDSGRSGCPSGTTVAVENLFYNVPARFKFLRKDATEAGAVTDVIERLALARPDVSFRLICNQQEILHTPGNNDLTSTIYAVYGKQVAAGCLAVDSAQPPLRLSGLVGRPELSRNSRAQQSFFVNGRLVRARSMTAALDDAYETLLMKGKYAFAVLFLQVPPQLVDVNVHPQKMEVRFWNDQDVFRMVYHALKNTLIAGAGVAGEAAAARIFPITAQPALPSTEYNLALPTEQPELLLHENESIPAKPSTAAPIPPAETPLNTGQQQVPLLKINDLDQARLIGQLFDTYILMELDQEMLLIDQHAAHEKIIFESLVAKHHQAQEQAAVMPVQDLLAPLVLETSRREMQFLLQEQALFQQLGFDYDVFGPSAIALRSLPDTGLHSLQPEAAFRLALDILLADLPNTEEKIADFYYSMACKAAVKAADHLKPPEIERLLADLRLLDNPYQCPHGRPVVVRLTRYELEKRFKRIV